MPSSYAPNVGGVEEVVARVADEMSKNGHSPSVLTNRWPRSLSAVESIEGIPVTRRAFRVPHRSARGMAGWLLLAGRTRAEVIRDARAHDADVINLHCVSTNSEFAQAAAKALSIPLVVSLHGELGNDATGSYAAGGRLVEQWRRLIDRADAITAPSRFVLNQAEAFRGVPFGDRASIVPNGVDLPAFAAPRRSVHRPYVLAVGRLVAPKGFDVLIEAWSQVRSDVDLILAGDGPEFENLSKLADKTRPRVQLVGSLSRAAVADRLAGASAFVLPSRAEPLGLVVLEAMAAQVPVIATRAGGVPEIVTDGQTGVLVPPGDATALANAIDDLLHDERLAADLASAARSSVLGRTWSACAEALLASYRRAGVI